MKLIFLITLFTFTFSLHSKEALEIYFFNVGQADSQLIIFPSGYSILIDVGDYDYDNASNTKHVAKKLEEILGHKSIDVFVCTHFHYDHFGYGEHTGIWYLIEKEGFTVKKFIKRNVGYYNGDSIDDCNKNTIVWKYAGGVDSDMAKGICYAISSKDKTKLSAVAENAHRCSRTQINPPDEGARVIVIQRDALGVNSEDSGSPLARDSTGDNPQVNENDFSICMRIEYGEFKYATCGDLSGLNYDSGGWKYHNVEKYVAEYMGEVDLYKVSHHGSTTSSNRVWCEATVPTVSVIPCGGGTHLPEPVPMGHLFDVGSVLYAVGDDCNQSTMRDYPDIKQMGDDVLVSVKLNGDTFTVAKASSPDDYDTYQIKKNKKAPKECTLLEGEEE